MNVHGKTAARIATKILVRMARNSSSTNLTKRAAATPVSYVNVPTAVP
jgi:hypothetical protein